MILKGHTSIELTDVNTGEKSVYEDTNMVTNALNEIFTNNRLCLKTRANLDMFLPLWEKGLSGIMCFDTELPEDKNLLYKPDGIEVVAHAGRVANNNKDYPKFGSFNEEESGKTEKGYKFVWDFTTSQGNGTIKSISLTSDSGGRFGYETNYAPVKLIKNGSGYIGEDNFLFNKNFHMVASNGYSGNRIYINKDTVYAVPKVEGTLVTIRKSIAYNKRVGILKYYNEPEVVEEKTFDLPVQGLDTISYVKIFVDSGNLYVICKTNTETSYYNGKISVYKIDFENGTKTLVLSPERSNNSFSGNICACALNGFLYIYDLYRSWSNNTYKILKFSLENGDIVYEKTFETSIDLICSMCNLLVIGYNADAYFVIRDDQDDFELIKIDTGTTNLDRYMQNVTNVFEDHFIHALDSYNLDFFGNSNSFNDYVVIDTNYLATINNLQSPITKTSSQTMKIIYTITEA